MRNTAQKIVIFNIASFCFVFPVDEPKKTGFLVAPRCIVVIFVVRRAACISNLRSVVLVAVIIVVVVVAPVQLRNVAVVAVVAVPASSASSENEEVVAVGVVVVIVVGVAAVVVVAGVSPVHLLRNLFCFVSAFILVALVEPKTRGFESA